MTGPHVVIVGGGFGGLAAARRLRNAPVTITLVDRRNHHVFQPLLYQVATAALSPADISAPIRSVLRRQRNAEVLMAEVTEIDREGRRVILSHGDPLAYDYLIVATGATHAYFGHPEWESVAPGLKTLEDATEIRRRVLLAFEAAEQEPDPEERRALLTFVVVGAGPTGVEMAGAMSEIARHSFLRDFRRIDPSQSRVVLIEGGPRVLAAYHEELSAYAMKALERIGVEVRTGSSQVRYGPITTGGALNLVTKKPGRRSFRSVSLSGGSAPSGRVEADINEAINDRVQVRLNAMGQLSGVAGRDNVTENRAGIAPSARIVLGERLASTGMFNQDFLRDVVEAHQSGRRDSAEPNAGPRTDQRPAERG